MTEPRKILLGVLDVTDGEAVAFDLPADLDPDAIKAAIERANIERAEAAKRETERLRQIFLDDTKAEGQQ